MKRKWTVIWLALLPSFCGAQFNDSVTHHIRLTASGNINRTATGTAYLLANDARFSIRNKRTTLNTAAAWVFGKQGGILTNNDFSATADFNVYRDSSYFYYWGLGNYTTSFSLKLNRQLQAGLGAAYNLVNTPNAWLNISNGLLYENSNLVRNGADEAYQTVRNSFRLSYRFTLANGLTLSGANFLQNSLRNTGDYIIRTANSVGFKVNRWLAFATTLTYNEVSRTGAENLLFTYGLTLENYY